MERQKPSNITKETQRLKMFLGQLGIRNGLGQAMLFVKTTTEGLKR